MENLELIKSAQKGDKGAYIELMNLHQHIVEKFAYQCGVKADDIQSVTQEVFIKLYRFLNHFRQEQLSIWLFKITLDIAKDYYRITNREKVTESNIQEEIPLGITRKSTESKVLVFEEDRELHKAIQSLEEKYRIPVVLYYFQELTHDQIGEVLNIPLSSVEKHLLSAKDQLNSSFELIGEVDDDKNQLKQQMTLLKKSYNRVPSIFNTEEVMSMIADENSKLQNDGTVDNLIKTSKWKIWAVSLASVFLIGILSASFIKQGKEQGSGQVSEIDSQEIEEFKKAFHKEKESRRKVLGMTAEQFNQVEFVSIADQLLERTIHPDSLESNVSSQFFADRNEQIIEMLKLPSEMVNDALLGDKLDEEDSMIFVDEFNTKIDDLIAVYNMTLERHKEILNTAKFNGEFSTPYLYNQRKNLPLEIENMIVNAPKQTINIEVAPDKTRYIAKFNLMDVRLDRVIDQSAFGMLALKQSAPYTYGGELTYEPQHSAIALEQMEKVLLSIDQQNAMYTVTKSYYEDLAYTLIFGSTNTQVIENNKLNEEFYLAWNYMQAMPGSSPIKYFIKPVYDSMTKNDWGITDTYTALDFKDFQEAFRLAETGELAALLPENETGLNSIEIQWPNTELLEEAHGFLKSPEPDGTYDYSKLSPINAVVLFHYVHQLEFQEIMYGLTSPFEGMGAQEEVVEVWKNTVLIPESATSLRYNDASVTARNGLFYGFVEVMKDKQAIISIPVIRDFEGIWKISPSINTYEEPIIGTIDKDYQNEVEMLFYEFKENLDNSLLVNKSPDIIASIYYKALQQGEMDVLYELSVKDDRLSLLTPDQITSEPTQNTESPFQSFEYIPVISQGEEYDLLIYFEIKREFQFGDETRKAISMRKTKDGWRVYFEPI